MVALISWWHAGRGDNFHTTEPTWTGSIGTMREGYRLYRVEGHLYRPDRPQPVGTVPLVSWWNGSRADNMAIAQPAWSGPIGTVKEGYRLYRVEGFLRPVP